MEELHRRVGHLFILPAEGPHQSLPNTLTISVWIGSTWPLGLACAASQEPLAPNPPFELWPERSFHVRSRRATPLICVTSHGCPIRTQQKGPASGLNDDGALGSWRKKQPVGRQLSRDLDIDLPLSTRPGAREHVRTCVCACQRGGSVCECVGRWNTKREKGRARGGAGRGSDESAEGLSEMTVAPRWVASQPPTWRRRLRHNGRPEGLLIITMDV